MELIGLDKSEYKVNIFLILSQKHVGTHQKCLVEVLLMSTHNICFHGDIRPLAGLMH